MENNPSKVAIVAHSFGGVCTVALVIWNGSKITGVFKLLLFLQVSHFKKEFSEKVFAVAFTDSAHYKLDRDGFTHLRKVLRFRY